MTSTLADRVRGSVLGERDFRLLWIGQAVSSVGDQIFPVAVAVLVLNSGGGVTDLGLVLAARWLGLVLFALVGGVYADRLPRTLVMRSADAFRAVVLLGLAALPSAPSFAVLALLVFLVGGGEAFFRPAETALLPSILPPQRLAGANALISVSYRTAAIVGPGIGAVVVKLSGGPRAAFLLEGITFGLSLVTLTLLHEPARERVAREDRPGMRAEIVAGTKEVVRRPWIAAVLVLTAVVMMLVVAPESVLLPVVGRETFGSDTVFATSLAMVAAGGVLGGLIAIRWRPRQPGLWGVLGFVPFAAIPLVLAYAGQAWVFFAAYFVAGLTFEPFLVYWQTALQRDIPSAMLARVSSLDWVTSLALLPLGMALTGPAVTALGQTTVLWVAAVVGVVAPFVALLVPGVRELRTPVPPGSAG
jgi:MFS family permease